ncbi:hypothetical protein VKS41_004920 [Umbelopsis sp. WA50703]
MADINAATVDFLNQHIPKHGGIDSLDALYAQLHDRQTNHQTLKQQLDDTTTKTRTTIASTLKRTQQAVEQLDSLKRRQTDAQQALETYCSQHRQDEKDTYEHAKLIRTLADLEGKLTKLDNTREYVKVLITADELSSRSKTLVKEDPRAALVPYRQLAKLAKLTETSSPEGCNAELIKYMTIRQSTLWEELKDILSKKFEETLQALQWPVPLKPPYSMQIKEQVKAFERAFSDLLILQQPMEDIGINQAEQDTKYQPLLPISIMMSAFSLRFRFHFEGSRPTNRLDKPEWFLNHTIQTISQHMPFFVGVVQPIIDNFKSPTLRHSARTDFIFGLLTDLSLKIKKSMPQMLAQPVLLSHTIHEVLSFDQTLQERYGFVAPEGSEFSLGLAQVIVGNPEWFDAWLKMEKQFAVGRFNEIVHDRAAWDLNSDEDQDTGDYMQEDEEYDEDKDAVPATKSAARVLSLIEGITDSYRLLPVFEQRLRFLMDIQIDLLETYHRRIASAVDSFEALSLIRSVPVPGALPDAVTGVMTSGEKSGTTGGLQRLCRWWASAITVRDRILEWGEDDFFLEMWTELNQRAAQAQSLSDLNTSLNALPAADTFEEGTVFTEVATELYDPLCAKLQKTVVKMVAKDWSVGARPYGKSRNWSVAPAETLPSEITPELYRPVADLKRNLAFLSSTLPSSLFHTVLRNILLEIDDWFWKNMITIHQFTRQGGYQLKLDVSVGIWQTTRSWTKKPENHTKRIKESLILLTLPSSTNTSTANQTSVYDPRFTCDFLINALSDVGQQNVMEETLESLAIDRLEIDQVRQVLRHRCDVAAGWF